MGKSIGFYRGYIKKYRRGEIAQISKGEGV